MKLAELFKSKTIVVKEEEKIYTINTYDDDNNYFIKKYGNVFLPDLKDSEIKNLLAKECVQNDYPICSNILIFKGIKIKDNQEMSIYDFSNEDLTMDFYVIRDLELYKDIDNSEEDNLEDDV